MPKNFSSTGGFDANHQRITNVPAPLDKGDALNFGEFEARNTVPAYDPTKTYAVGFIVENDTRLWKCISQTSGAFDHTKWVSIAASGKWINLTGDTYTAVAGDNISVTPTQNTRITLPRSPRDGDSVTIALQSVETFYGVAIDPNGSTVDNKSGIYTLADNGSQFRLVYHAGTWRLNINRATDVKVVSVSGHAVSNTEYLVTGQLSLTLPPTPSIGDWVIVTDIVGGVEGIIVWGGANPVNGVTGYGLRSDFESVRLVYTSTGWISRIVGQGYHLALHNNLSDLPNKHNARNALGLGTAAVAVIGSGEAELSFNRDNIARFQPKDATLTGLSDVSTANDTVIYATGVDRFDTTPLTKTGRDLIGATTFEQVLAMLGVDVDVDTLNGVISKGQFGLGGVLTEIQDLSTLSVTTIGFVSKTNPNAPSTLHDAIVTHYEAVSGATQFAIDGGNVMHTRSRVNGVWGNWITSAPADSLGTAALLNAEDVVKVGDYGIGSSAVYVSNVDDIYLTGFYAYDTSTVGLPNETSTGYMTVISGDYGFTQNIVDAYQNISMRRAFLNDTNGFTNWEHNVTNANIGWIFDSLLAGKITNGDNTKPIGEGSFGTNGGMPIEVASADTITVSGKYNFGSGINQLIIEHIEISNGSFTAYQSSVNLHTGFMWFRYRSPNGVWGTWTPIGSDAGEIIATIDTTRPHGTLHANGAAVSRTTYARLFAKIGTRYGAGDGSTTFNLPDLRGEFLRGVDSGRGVDAGRTLGTVQGDAMRNITGGFSAAGAVSWQTPYGAFAQSGAMATHAGAAGTNTGGVTLEFAASRQVPVANEFRPRNVAVLYCIRY